MFFRRLQEAETQVTHHGREPGCGDKPLGRTKPREDGRQSLTQPGLAATGSCRADAQTCAHHFGIFLCPLWVQHKFQSSRVATGSTCPVYTLRGL